MAWVETLLAMRSHCYRPRTSGKRLHWPLSGGVDVRLMLQRHGPATALQHRSCRPNRSIQAGSIFDFFWMHHRRSLGPESGVGKPPSPPSTNFAKQLLGGLRPGAATRCHLLGLLIAGDFAGGGFKALKGRPLSVGACGGQQAWDSPPIYPGLRSLFFFLCL